MKTKKELPECPVAATISVIGNKWKLLILRDILNGPKRFNELQKSLVGINQKVLAENLKQMEADGLVVRIAWQDKPPCVQYKLSELGESLRPLIAEMEQWGMRYKQQLD